MELLSIGEILLPQVIASLHTVCLLSRNQSSEVVSSQELKNFLGSRISGVSGGNVSQAEINFSESAGNELWLLVLSLLQAVKE